MEAERDSIWGGGKCDKKEMEIEVVPGRIHKQRNAGNLWKLENAKEQVPF